MNTIIIILIVAVSVLYLKWFFVILLYPIMALSAIGFRQSNRKSRKILQFPLRVAEHFLRFGGVDLSFFRYPSFHLYTCVYGYIRDWA